MARIAWTANASNSSSSANSKVGTPCCDVPGRVPAAGTPKLLFTGKVHQGLNPQSAVALSEGGRQPPQVADRQLLKLLQPLATKKCPFANLPTSGGGPLGRGRRLGPAQWGEGVPAEEMNDYVWLHPEIEAEIKFAEWTQGGLLRHAEFVTVREA